MLPSAPVYAPTDSAVETRWLRIRGIERRILATPPPPAAAAAGASEPLVLLHGIAGSADEWLGVMPALAGRFRVLAPDAPGHGLSAKPACRDGHRYDLAYYVESTLAVLDALGVTRAPLVALSGAGPVALSIARQHPQRVSKLILVGAAGLGREVAWRYRLATLPLMHLVFRRRDRRSIERFGRAMCHAPDRLPAGWVERRLEIWDTPGAVEAFFATLHAGVSLAGQRLTFAAALAEIRQPTLLIWGRQDPIIPVTHALAASRALPDARLLIFEECGHMPMWEHPQRFVQAVQDFLTRTGD
ncbi:MAG TPA: alpha/beta fold hydrolase [Chloroflexota bacterium]|nr:alpha/beta fold hydrolase [Chloroflexota bacterium]